MRVEPRIVGVDRLRDAVVVSFDDGSTVLYSSALLQDVLGMAEDLTNLPNPDDDE